MTPGKGENSLAIEKIEDEKRPMPPVPHLRKGALENIRLIKILLIVFQIKI
ncbi:MAG: hypothetical protein R3B45_01140 [Bdellovibrionota bacterium]